MRFFILFCILGLMLGHNASEALTLQGKVTETHAVQPVLEGNAYQQNEPGIVGMNMEIRRNAVPMIVEVYPDTPAQHAGLHHGDEILAINQLSTKGMSMQQVDAAISDVPGDKVQLLVSRQGYVFGVELTVQSISQVHVPEVRALFDSLFP